jgi:hypothetical protein
MTSGRSVRQPASGHPGVLSCESATDRGAVAGYALRGRLWRAHQYFPYEPLILGYTGGTALLQIGYQAGGALTVAGIATLLTNALPIAAGTIVLDETVPPGVLGGLRVMAFIAVITGSVLLARPDKPSKTRTQHGAAKPAPS